MIIDNSSLTFTTSNWDTAQTITVAADDDSTVEDNHSNVIDFSVSGGGYDNAVFVVDDTEKNSLSVNITDNDIAPMENVKHQLTVNKIGNGAITTDYGINCGNDCENEFADQSEISLTTTPDIGWIFDSWTGDCDENGEVRINSDKYCTAVFLKQHILNINVKSQGIVDNCGTSCTQTHLAGEIINLTTTTEGIWALDNWNGNCDEAGKVIMDSDKTYTATFVEGYPLVITIAFPD